MGRPAELTWDCPFQSIILFMVKVERLQQIHWYGFEITSITPKRYRWMVLQVYVMSLVTGVWINLEASHLVGQSKTYDKASLSSPCPFARSVTGDKDLSNRRKHR